MRILVIERFQVLRCSGRCNSQKVIFHETTRQGGLTSALSEILSTGRSSRMAVAPRVSSSSFKILTDQQSPFSFYTYILSR